MENQATEKQIWRMKKEDINIPSGCTMSHANTLLKAKLDGGARSEEEMKATYTSQIDASTLKARPKSQDQPSYYVAYAKDLFIAQCEAGSLEGTTSVALMEECVSLVLQAKRVIEKAFQE